VCAASASRFEVVATWELAQELLAVVARPKLRRYRITPKDERQVLVLLARAFPSIEMNVPLRDPDDAAVVAAALADHAEAIVTGDRDLLEDGELQAWLRERGVEVLTPIELLARLG